MSQLDMFAMDPAAELVLYNEEGACRFQEFHGHRMPKLDTEWNPRFVVFARAHGATPEEARAAMKRREPPFFVIWINERWSEWRRLNKRERFCPLSTEDHAAFDAWLPAHVQAMTGGPNAS